MIIIFDYMLYLIFIIIIIKKKKIIIKFNIEKFLIFKNYLDFTKIYNNTDKLLTSNKTFNILGFFKIFLLLLLFHLLEYFDLLLLFLFVYLKIIL